MKSSMSRYPSGEPSHHRQPAIRIVVGLVVPGLSGVVDRRLRPDLAGAQIDPPAAVGRVALEDGGQLLEVHRKGAQHRCRLFAEGRVELFGKVLVALPASCAELRGALARQFGSPIDALCQSDQETVAGEL
jgi:hypothetical protein